MSLFRRIFSSDYRAALAAEAGGDFKRAAQLYALAGVNDKVGEMHLRRAEGAKDAEAEMAALREAIRWAAPDTPVRRKACGALGRALLEKGRAEGVATERDRERMREAAALLEEAGAFAEAGAVHEELGDDEAAARAYGRGGLLDRMEQALDRDTDRAARERRLRQSYRDYEARLKSGDRDAAMAALRECVDAAEDKGHYRRLLDELEARRLSGGRLRLRAKPNGALVVVCDKDEVTLGRDALCDVPLRTGNVSRVHAEVRRNAEGFFVRDAGSKNGTWLADMPVAGEVPLRGEGALRLGDDCELLFHTREAVLTLEVRRGLDRGVRLVCLPGEGAHDLEGSVGLAATLEFRRGTPHLRPKSGGLVLNGEGLSGGEVQLVRGDALRLGETEVDVL